MLSKEIINIYPKNHTKYIHTVCVCVWKMEEMLQAKGHEDKK